MGSSVAHSNWKELKVFFKKLDNSKNLCYNKYVRLRGNKPSTSCGRGGTADTGDSKSPANSVRVRISPPARGKVEPGVSVAAQFPKISKEVNGKEISR